MTENFKIPVESGESKKENEELEAEIINVPAGTFSQEEILTRQAEDDKRAGELRDELAQNVAPDISEEKESWRRQMPEIPIDLIPRKKGGASSLLRRIKGWAGLIGAAAVGLFGAQEGEAAGGSEKTLKDDVAPIVMKTAEKPSQEAQVFNYEQHEADFWLKDKSPEERAKIMEARKAAAERLAGSKINSNKTVAQENLNSFSAPTFQKVEKVSKPAIQKQTRVRRTR